VLRRRSVLFAITLGRGDRIVGGQIALIIAARDDAGDAGRRSAVR